jgi:hypothetical protein
MSDRQQEQERTRIRLTVDRHSESEPLGNGRVRVVEKITRTYEPFELTRERIRDWVQARLRDDNPFYRGVLFVPLAEGDVIDGYRMLKGYPQTIVWAAVNEFRRLGFQVKE